MPTVTLFIATSLDGFIADANGDVDWLFHDADYGYESFFASVDALVMGRRTFGQVLGFGGWPYEDKPTRVFGKGSGPADAPSCVRMTTGPARAVLDELGSEGARHVWLVGGAGLVKTFREEDLIDRYVISVHPLLLGTGTPLFDGPLPRRDLELEGAERFASGLVQISYRRGRGG